MKRLILLSQKLNKLTNMKNKTVGELCEGEREDDDNQRKARLK